MGGCLSQPVTTTAAEQEPVQINLPKRSSQGKESGSETPRNSKFIDRLVSMESPRSPQSPAHPRYVNAAYWPQWIAYHDRFPSTFDLSKLSHVFYAFASINPEGTIRCTDDRIDVQLPVDGTTGCIKAWTQLKFQHPNLKIILSIGGEGASSRRYAWVGSDAQRREHFAVSAKHFLQLYNLDGIDINWDPGTAEEGQNLLELIKTIRKVFNYQFAPRFVSTAPKYMITASLPTTQRILRHVPLAALSKELDLVNLMAYDFVNPQSQETGHHAQLSTGRPPYQRFDNDQSCEIAVDYLKREGVPSNKLLLGIPLFGRSFLGADGPYQRFTEVGGINGTHEVRNLPRPGTQEIYEEDVGAVWCASANEFVSYDNIESVFEKAWFVKDMGLAGLFFWHMGYDRVGEQSLIRKGWDTLNEVRAGHS